MQWDEFMLRKVFCYMFRCWRDQEWQQQHTQNKKKYKNKRSNTYIITDGIVDVRWYFDNLWGVCTRIIRKAPRIAGKTGGRITLCCHFVLLNCEMVAMCVPLLVVSISILLLFLLSFSKCCRLCDGFVCFIYLLMFSPFYLVLPLSAPRSGRIMSFPAF